MWFEGPQSGSTRPLNTRSWVHYNRLNKCFLFCSIEIIAESLRLGAEGQISMNATKSSNECWTMNGSSTRLNVNEASCRLWFGYTNPSWWTCELLYCFTELLFQKKRVYVRYVEDSVSDLYHGPGDQSSTTKQRTSYCFLIVTYWCTYRLMVFSNSEQQTQKSGLLSFRPGVDHTSEQAIYVPVGYIDLELLVTFMME